jgi:hypothetical protein
MTEEMKSNDANRYVVVNATSNVIEATQSSEGDAKAAAERLAANHEATEFIVYQKIGSATATVKVEWKGAAR